MATELKASPVEVTVSERCEHNCYTISLGSRSIWHLAGAPPISVPAEDRLTFHHHDDDHGATCDCWRGQD